jgi:hypothetical protein
MSEVVWYEAFGYLGSPEKENLQKLIPENHVPRYAYFGGMTRFVDGMIEYLQALKADGAIAVVSGLGWRPDGDGWRVIGSRPMTEAEVEDRAARSTRAKAAAERRKMKQTEKEIATAKVLAEKHGLAVK